MAIRSIETTIKFINNFRPAFDELFSCARKSGGKLILPDNIVDLLTKEGLPSWCTFYEDERRLKSLTATALIGPENIEQMVVRIKKSTPEEIETIKDELTQEALDSELFQLDIDDMEDIDPSYIEQEWAKLTPSEKLLEQKRLYLLLYSFVTYVNYYFAIMTFGRSICSLVSDAKNGDDIAFCQAVQIDKSILTEIPYFRKRLSIANFSEDSCFLAKLSNALIGKSLGTKMTYPKLMLVFALLDDEGYLDLPLHKLMEVCEEVGVYGREFGVMDTESLRKRRKYYRDKTGRQKAF